MTYTAYKDTIDEEQDFVDAEPARQAAARPRTSRCS